jgi:GrpB-like predicted nucleotidyltransferase (UPF0157 family)
MKLLDPSEYQPAAHAVFKSVSDELIRLLPGARIEHVGASSIPGAVSKGDLDICVVVPANDHAATVHALEACGYVVKADTLRTPELCMLLSPRKDSDVALQVVTEGSRFEFFMRFRDAMRADPLLVERYNQVKRDFVHSGTGRYRDEKTKFIEAVLRST